MTGHVVGLQLNLTCFETARPRMSKQTYCLLLSECQLKFVVLPTYFSMQCLMNCVIASGGRGEGWGVTSGEMGQPFGSRVCAVKLYLI